MTSKSELKRTATLDPVDAAERIYALERELANERAGQRAMDADWHEREERAHHLELENAALRRDLDVQRERSQHLERELAEARAIARELLDMQHSREQLAAKGLEEYGRLLAGKPRPSDSKESPVPPIVAGTTGRGFALAEFVDRNGVKCSLQKSSIATEDAIWLGCDDENPRVMVAGKGWQPVAYAVAEPEPDNLVTIDAKEMLVNTRMHLTREQVAALLPLLQGFVDCGEVPADSGPLAVVLEQAEDEGLWFMAKTAPEAYLQAALRRLHAAIECNRERDGK